jgi:hypothetical protein
VDSVTRAQVTQFIADVIEHDIGAVALALAGDAVTAFAVEHDIGGIGIAEQVVDIAQGLLIGADHENSQAVAFAFVQRMHGQRMAERPRLHIGIDAAVGIAGQVGDHAVTQRTFIQTRDRHDRKHLVDGPDVGYGFEHREVDEVLVDQPLVEVIEHFPMAFVIRVQ